VDQPRIASHASNASFESLQRHVHGDAVLLRVGPWPDHGTALAATTAEDDANAALLDVRQSHGLPGIALRRRDRHQLGGIELWVIGRQAAPYAVLRDRNASANSLT
jgi:hypothetical protein